MEPTPRTARAHSRLVADEYLRLGWTLRRELYAGGADEPYEYFFTWDADTEPAGIDWAEFSRRVLSRWPAPEVRENW
jgi:hypothetical protein